MIYKGGLHSFFDNCEYWFFLIFSIVKKLIQLPESIDGFWIFLLFLYTINGNPSTSPSLPELFNKSFEYLDQPSCLVLV